MKIRLTLLALAATAAIFAQPSTTTLVGPVYDAFGQLYGGSMLVQGQVKTNVGYVVAGTTRTVFITSGAVSLSLVPNDTSLPSGTAYLVTFSNGDKWTCTVPTSGMSIPFVNTGSNGGSCTPNAGLSLPFYQFQSISGDVTITPGSPSSTVNLVGGQAAANVASATQSVSAATSANTPSTIVKRDGSGNFSGGLNGNASTATALAAAPAVCSGISFATGVSVSGAAYCNPGNINVALFDASPALSCSSATSHDNQTAANAAIAYAASIGGGTVTFPANGKCYFNSYYHPSSGSNSQNILNVPFSYNVTIDWNGATPYLGNGISTGSILIADGIYVDSQLIANLGNYCSILPSTRGQWYVDLNGSCGSYTFNAGDAVYLQSGSVVMGTPFNSEMNMVSYISGSRMYLTYPTSHAYVNDNVNPFGIVDAEALTLHNFIVKGLRTPAQFRAGILALVQSVHTRLEDSILRTAPDVEQFVTGYNRDYVFRDLVSSVIDPGHQFQGSNAMSEIVFDHVIMNCYTTGDDRLGGSSDQLTFTEGSADWNISKSRFTGNCGSGNNGSDNTEGLRIVSSEFDLNMTTTEFGLASAVTDLDIESSVFKFQDATTLKHDMFLGGVDCKFLNNTIYASGPAGLSSIAFNKALSGCQISGNTGAFVGNGYEFGDSSGGGHGFVFSGNTFTGSGASWGVAVDNNGSVTQGATITGNSISGFAVGVDVSSLTNEGNYEISKNNLNGNTAAYSPSTLLPVSGVVHADASGHTSASAVSLPTDVSGALPCANTPALTGDATTSAGSCATTVATVGASTAANIHTAEQAANAATNADTPSTLVKRDSSGNFSAGTVNLAGLNLNAVSGSTMTLQTNGVTKLTIQTAGNAYITTPVSLELGTTTDEATFIEQNAANVWQVATSAYTSAWAPVTNNANPMGVTNTAGACTLCASYVGAYSFRPNSTQTVVAGSVSGQLTGTMPDQGASGRKVYLVLSALNGTATYTFPQNFTNTPGIFAPSTALAATVTTLSTTGVTITGGGLSGVVILEGF